MFSHKIIENSINELVKVFSKRPDLFLTESDLRCYLAAELLKIPDFSSMQKTIDGFLSIPLHSEVRWYGKSGKLKYRSDVVILSPEDLRVKEKTFKLPSKGYGFNHFWAIIELKLRRINGKSDNQFFKDAKYEVDKLRKIERETQYNNKYKALYYVLCFDKRNDITNRIEKIKEKRIIVKYTFSK